MSHVGKTVMSNSNIGDLNVMRVVSSGALQVWSYPLADPEENPGDLYRLAFRTSLT